MPSGRLAATTLTSGSNVVVYSCPVFKLATININICNVSSSQRLVNLAVVTGSLGSLTDNDYIEYRYPLEGNGMLERTGLVLSASQSVLGFVDGPGVATTVWGVEE